MSKVGRCMSSLGHIVRFRGQLNRLEFLTCLSMVVLIYVAITYFATKQLFIHSSLNRLAFNSVCEFIFSVACLPFVVARLRSIGISKAWGSILFLPWLFGLNNIFLFDYYVNDSQGTSPEITYLSIFTTGITYLLIIFLLLKPGQEQRSEKRTPKLGQ